jgi:anti-sigma factor RsiW
MRSLDDLTMYVYGLLDESAETEIRDHAKACPDCAAQIGRIAAEHRLLEKALGTKAGAPSRESKSAPQKHQGPPRI